MIDGLEVFEATENHALGQWRGALLYVWRRHTTEEAVELLRQRGATLNASGSGSGVFFGAVEPLAPYPDARARQALSNLMSGFSAEQIHASALVFDGTGLRGAGVRAVASALTLLSWLPFPHQVFATLDEGADFLSSRLRSKKIPSYEAAELAQALRDLRGA